MNLNQSSKNTGNIELNSCREFNNTFSHPAAKIFKLQGNNLVLYANKKSGKIQHLNRVIKPAYIPQKNPPSIVIEFSENNEIEQRNNMDNIKFFINPQIYFESAVLNEKMILNEMRKRELMFTNIADNLDGYITLIHINADDDFSRIRRVFLINKSSGENYIIKQTRCKVSDLATINSARDEYNICQQLGSEKGYFPEVLDSEQFIHMDYESIETLYKYAGESLDKIIKTNPVDDELIYNWAIQLASAIAILHKANIAHSDIKPQNIVYSVKQKQLKLIDLGSAVRTGKLEAVTKRMKAFVKEGTPDYMPSEFFYQNWIDFSLEKMDVYSWGMTMLHLIFRMSSDLLHETSIKMRNSNEDREKIITEIKNAKLGMNSEKKCKSFKAALISSLSTSAISRPSFDKIVMSLENQSPLEVVEDIKVSEHSQNVKPVISDSSDGGRIQEETNVTICNLKIIILIAGVVIFLFLVIFLPIWFLVVNKKSAGYWNILWQDNFNDSNEFVKFWKTRLYGTANSDTIEYVMIEKDALSISLDHGVDILNIISVDSKNRTSIKEGKGEAYIQINQIEGSNSKFGIKTSISSDSNCTNYAYISSNGYQSNTIVSGINELCWDSDKSITFEASHIVNLAGTFNQYGIIFTAGSVSFIVNNEVINSYTKTQAVKDGFEWYFGERDTSIFFEELIWSDSISENFSHNIMKIDTVAMYKWAE